MSRRRSVASILGALALSLVFAAGAFAQNRDENDLARKQLEYTRAHYTKHDYRIPMRDGVKLFTSVYVPKDAEPGLSDADGAHPLLRRPVRRRQIPDGPRPFGSVRKGGLHLRLPGRARALHVRRGVRRRRPSQDQLPGPRTPTKAPTPTTPSTGWSRTCRTTTAGWASGASPIRASTPPFGLIDAHPALKAVSPQAPDGRRGTTATTPSTTAPSTWPRISASIRASSRARAARPSRRGHADSTSARPTPTISICGWGPSPTSNDEVLQGREPLLGRQPGSPDTTTNSGRSARWRRT